MVKCDFATCHTTLIAAMFLQRVLCVKLAVLAQLATCGPLKLKVQTSNGLIEGHAAQNRSAVAEFLGIPYAQPPIGDLRFAAPEAYSANSPYTAANFVSKQPNSAVMLLLVLTFDICRDCKLWGAFRSRDRMVNVNPVTALKIPDRLTISIS